MLGTVTHGTSHTFLWSRLPMGNGGLTLVYHGQTGVPLGCARVSVGTLPFVRV